MIVIIDYGMGNVGSIVNMLKKIGTEATITSSRADIQQADKLILPGVGAFDHGMQNLAELELIDILNEKILNEKIPVLGICLGMQLLTTCSEEGVLPGLNWIHAETKRFHFDTNSTKLKIPHMGWNTVNIEKQDRLLTDLYQNARFYFVHSYHVVCNHKSDVLTTTFHGYHFVSAVARENILGVQFHPEKSHKFGMKLLKNFVEYY